MGGWVRSHFGSRGWCSHPFTLPGQGGRRAARSASMGQKEKRGSGGSSAVKKSSSTKPAAEKFKTAKIGRFGLDGAWRTGEGTLELISGLVLMWSDGMKSVIKEYGENKIAVARGDHVYTATVKGNQLVWDDGDKWAPSKKKASALAAPPLVKKATTAKVAVAPAKKTAPAPADEDSYTYTYEYSDEEEEPNAAVKKAAAAAAVKGKPLATDVATSSGTVVLTVEQAHDHEPRDDLDRFLTYEGWKRFRLSEERAAGRQYFSRCFRQQQRQRKQKKNIAVGSKSHVEVYRQP